MSTNLDRAAIFSYLYCLDLLQREMKLGEEETSGDLLTRVGGVIFGKKFVGAHARDAFPFPTLKSGDMGIMNNQDTGSPGEHWVAVARGVERPSRIFIYDSFGRTGLIKPQHIRSLPRGSTLHPATPDIPQDDDEDNCGQRCLAWLMVFDQCGERLADLI